MSRGSRGARQFEDVYRIYHEVEDVGKTVKASKRRARWTFCFGEAGDEREVVLIHSVVSGKKSITYNHDEIHHNDELSRAFSYTWYDGDHSLRVDILDIVEVGTSMAKGSARGDKMYELTLDGVPFNILPVKPMYPAGNRSKMAPPARKSSYGGGGGSSGPPLRQSSFGGEDDFNPRGASSVAPTKVAPPVVKAKPAPAPVDLLGVGDGGGGGGPSSTFDPFGGPDPFAAKAPGAEFGDFATAPTTQFGAPSAPPSSSTFDAFAPAPARGRSGSTMMTAHDLAMELGTASFNPSPPRPTGGGSTGFGAAPALPLSASVPTSSSTSLVATTPAGPGNDVDKVTASLVNLNNILDDKPAQEKNVYKPVYTDNRSLEEMKASQPKITGQPAKPIFIERPQPTFAPAPPRPGFGGGGFGGPGPMMGGPPRPGGGAMMSPGPFNGLGPAGPMTGGPMGGPMMGGGPMGRGPGLMMGGPMGGMGMMGGPMGGMGGPMGGMGGNSFLPPPRPVGPTGLGAPNPGPMGGMGGMGGFPPGPPGGGGMMNANAFPAPPMNGFGGPARPPAGPGFTPPRPPSNDPFAGLSSF